MAFETSGIPHFELPFCKQSCLNSFVWQLINNWCFARPCSRWISIYSPSSHFDIVPFHEVFYLTFKVLSPEDGVLVPRCYMGFLLLDFAQLRGRRAMTNNLFQLYSWYAHMISAFVYTSWDKNYRVKSLRKKNIYIFICCYLFFLARDLTKKSERFSHFL